MDGSERAWETIKAGNDGLFQHQALQGGYAYFNVPSERERILILEASGHSAVYVNGEPAPATPTAMASCICPCNSRKGATTSFFRAAEAGCGSS